MQGSFAADKYPSMSITYVSVQINLGTTMWLSSTRLPRKSAPPTAGCHDHHMRVGEREPVIGCFWLYHTPGDVRKFGARYQSTGITTGLAIALHALLWEDAPVSVPLMARKYLSDLQHRKYVLPTPRVPVLRARLDQAGGRYPSRLIFQCISSPSIPTFSTLPYRRCAT
ncbi:hypothetical protein BDN71DRAFT_651709 [Pleurotus eryngii]|uniref:Uncharacterized protein n=1 Tax=Pleurotus eryngii TaxID=5323 RepID=A0A9P5ZG09_PLEER|nr:hypothetical protein BDN71DRAFT_651709 [Pleurotus eryngii]